MKINPSLTFAVLLIFAPAAHAQFTYTNINGTITITGYTNTNNVVVVPNTIDGMPVTGIGSFAFNFDTNLTSITVSKGVISIGQRAFLNCTSLTNVNLPDSVMCIGRSAFAGCSSLSSVAIPQSVTSFYVADIISPETFADCTNLTRVFFQGNAPRIGSVGSDSLFDGDNNATVYYLAGTAGWTTNFGGAPRYWGHCLIL